MWANEGVHPEYVLLKIKALQDKKFKKESDVYYTIKDI